MTNTGFLRVFLAVVSLSLLSSSICGAASPTVVLRNKSTLNAEAISFDGKEVTTEEGKKIPRELIHEIYFVDKGGTKTQKESVRTSQPLTAEEKERVAEWYRQSSRLQRQFPGSDGIILLDEVIYRFKADGTYTRTYRGVAHALNDGNVKEYSRLAGFVEEGRNRHRFDFVNVYHRSGKCKRFEATRVKETQAQEGARFFTRGKTVSYPVVGMAKDAIIDYQYTYEYYNPFRKDFFFPQWGFQSGQPVLLSRIAFDLPQGKPFYYSLYNIDGHAPVVADVNDGKTRHLDITLQDVPPFIPEKNSVQYSDVAPYFKGSVLKSWQEIFTFLKKMHMENVKPSPELEAITKKIIKDCNTDEEKVAAIYHYLQEEIRYIAIKMGVASGWGGFPAEMTWAKKYGCCIDKALVFTAMLDIAGIWSSPVILSVNSSADTKFNLPQIGFNHAISVVKVGDKKIFLDSTGSNARYPSHSGGNHGVKCINVFEEKIETIPVPKPEDNGAVYYYVLELNSEGNLDVNWKPTYVGNKESGLRGYYKRVKEDNRRQVMEAIVTREHPAAQLKQYQFHNLDQLSKPFYFTIDYHIPSYPKIAGPLRIFELPSMKRAFSETGLKERKFPVEYSTSMGERRIYTLKVAPNLRAKFIPKDVLLKNPIATYSLKTTKVNEHEFRIDSNFQRFGRIVEPHRWPAYREFLSQVVAATEQKLFFEVVK